MADTYARATTAADPLTGRLLDRRYRLGRRIARGGMASVYEATDVRLDRTVAVKVMHPGLGDDDVAQRFVREARAAARLSHPHVVSVHDQGEDDGIVFLAMEHVPGHTLRDVIRAEAPMRPERALALAEPIVSALAAAHRAGLVHRDVKPENVLIAEDPHGDHPGDQHQGRWPGQVKVADFGLAKAVSADTQHTATGGVLIGTVSYIAPELVIEGRADARADVYAVGIVLFELLTGRKPHEGETPIQVAYKHVNHDVPAPSTLVPGLPAYVDALVARATARDRSLRPADAGVLLHQVRRVGQALRAGVERDEELTADLSPLPAPVAGPDQADQAGPGAPEATDELGGYPVDEPTAPVRGITTRAMEPLARSTPAPERPAAVPVTERRRSVRGPLSLLLAVVILTGLGAGAWWFGWARYTSTPGVLGLQQAAAVDRLEAAGLGAEVADPAYSETVPEGEVIATEPEPGSRVLDDGTVVITLSLGPERYDVPRLAGKSEDAAQDALLATRLGVGEAAERWSEKVPEGTVIATRPATGTTLRPDTAVSLVVSKGPRPRKVADLTGESLDRAERVLGRKGLEVEVTDEEFSDTVDEGDIISQDPTDGTLFKGDTVEVVVSQGPELVEVPGVIAQGVDSATEDLEAAGFEVEVRQDPSSIGLGFVFRMDPGAGDMAPRGSTITIYLI